MLRPSQQGRTLERWPFHLISDSISDLWLLTSVNPKLLTFVSGLSNCHQLPVEVASSNQLYQSECFEAFTPSFRHFLRDEIQRWYGLVVAGFVAASPDGNVLEITEPSSDSFIMAELPMRRDCLPLWSSVCRAWSSVYTFHKACHMVDAQVGRRPTRNHFPNQCSPNDGPYSRTADEYQMCSIEVASNRMKRDRSNNDLYTYTFLTCSKSVDQRALSLGETRPNNAMTRAGSWVLVPQVPESMGVSNNGGLVTYANSRKQGTICSALSWFIPSQWLGPDHVGQHWVSSGGGGGIWGGV